jgi:hypothetical protein
MWRAVPLHIKYPKTMGRLWEEQFGPAKPASIRVGGASGPRSMAHDIQNPDPSYRKFSFYSDGWRGYCNFLSFLDAPLISKWEFVPE